MYKLVDNQYELKNFHAWLESQKGQFVGLDTETTGLRPLTSKVLLLQIGNKQQQFVLDIARLQKPGSDEIAHVLKQINKYDIKCIAHNAQFDYKMLKHHFGVELENIVCTLLSARLLTMGFSFNISMSLEHTLERYLGIKIEKETRATFHEMSYGEEFTEEQVRYSAFDVAHLVPLKDVLMKKLDRAGLLKIALVEFNTIKVTGDMELNGALIDTKLWKALEEVALGEADNIKKELDSLFAPYVEERNLFDEVIINYNSQPQMVKYLSKALGQTLKSTDVKTLTKINKPITNKLLAYRKQMKLASTYGSDFLKNNLDVDGKIRSDFNQLGADTGRYASKNPNLQNIPRDNRYRRPFIAPSGYKFISTDFSGQELRLLAHLSEEPEMIKALKENKDLHSYSASLLYNIPYEDFFEYEDEAKTIIKKDSKGDPVFVDAMKKLRTNTKSITFGL